MKKLTIIIISFVIVLCALIAIFLSIKVHNISLIPKVGSSVTEPIILSNAERIMNNHTQNNSATAKIYTKDNKNYAVTYYNNISKLPFFVNMEDNERILYIDANNGSFFGHKSDHREIYALFETFKFLHDRVLPYEIVAICIYYFSNGMDDIGKVITIPYSVFEQTYDSIDIKSISDAQISKAIADDWISKTGYDERNSPYPGYNSSQYDADYRDFLM